MINNELEFFLSQLVDEAHGNLPEDFKVRTINELYPRLEKHILVSLVQALPDNEECDRELQELMNRNVNIPDMRDFFGRYIPNVNAVTKDALEEFRDVYIGSIGK